MGIVSFGFLSTYTSKLLSGLSGLNKNFFTVLLLIGFLILLRVFILNVLYIVLYRGGLSLRTPWYFMFLTYFFLKKYLFEHFLIHFRFLSTF